MLLVQLPRFDSQVHLNHAPAAVFVALGVVIGVVVVLLYLTTGIGGEKDHWYGDPSRQFHLPRWGPSRYGPFGGFGSF